MVLLHKPRKKGVIERVVIDQIDRAQKVVRWRVEEREAVSARYALERKARWSSRDGREGKREEAGCACLV